MAKKREIIRCIYCKKDKLESDEHVLQRNLGGNLILRDVCQDCNNSFSRIDQALAETYLVGMYRAAVTPLTFPVRQGGDTCFRDPVSGMWLDLKVVNKMRAQLAPQIWEATDGSLGYQCSSVDDLLAFFKLIEKRVAKGKLHSTRIKTKPPEHASPTRLVQRGKEDMFVRAPTVEKAQAYLKKIGALWPEIVTSLDDPRTTKTHGTVEKPEAMTAQSIVLDDIYRAATKTAFNYLAYRLGAAFALRGDFDEVREYIRGTKLVHKPEAELDDGEIAVDHRFVRIDWNDPTRVFAEGEQHTVVLHNIGRTVACILNLYGQFEFIIVLGATDVDDLLMEGHEFSIDGTANSALSMTALAERLSRWRLRRAQEPTSLDG